MILYRSPDLLRVFFLYYESIGADGPNEVATLDRTGMVSRGYIGEN